MTIDQISVFLENRAGQLAEITSILSDNDIVLRAVSIAETKDYGILRLLTDRPAMAAEILRSKGFIFSITPINAIPVSDAAGGLNELLKKIDMAGIDVQYMYSVYSLKDKVPYMMIRVDDPAKLEAALA